MVVSFYFVILGNISEIKSVLYYIYISDAVSSKCDHHFELCQNMIIVAMLLVIGVELVGYNEECGHQSPEISLPGSIYAFGLLDYCFFFAIVL